MLLIDAMRLFCAMVVLQLSACTCFGPVDELDDGGSATGGGSGVSGGGSATSGGGAATSGGGVGTSGGGSATGGGVGASGGGAATSGGGVGSSGGGVGATGGGTNSGGDAGVEPTLYALAKPDYAPNDGPAVHMYLSNDPLDCPVPSGEGLLIDVWVDELSPGSYSLSPDFSDDGTACACGIVANFIQTGTLQLDVVDAGTASGRVDLVFQQGSDVHGPLQVKLCPGVRQCG